MTHKNLLVWKKAMELVVAIYNFTNDLPQKEDYGLTSQLHRASVSIPSNISEGAGRNTSKDYLKYLHNSMGSLNEVETQYQLCVMLGLSKQNPDLEEKMDHTGRLLMNQIKSLRRKIAQ